MRVEQSFNYSVSEIESVLRSIADAFWVPIVKRE